MLCIGSSSLRFWHDNISDDLQPLTLIPRGFGGSTMLDVLYYSAQIVVPYRPRAILLYEGDNDIDFGVSPARFLATVRQFLEVVDAMRPETRIYILADDLHMNAAGYEIWRREVRRVMVEQEAAYE